MVLWLGVNLLLSLCLRTVNFTSVSGFLPAPLRLEKMLETELNISLPQISQALIITQQIRIWLTSFPLRAGLLKKSSIFFFFELVAVYCSLLRIIWLQKSAHENVISTEYQHIFWAAQTNEFHLTCVRLNFSNYYINFITSFFFFFFFQHISKWFLLPSSCQKPEGNFLRHLSWESPVAKSHSIVPSPPPP